MTERAHQPHTIKGAWLKRAPLRSINAAALPCVLTREKPKWTAYMLCASSLALSVSLHADAWAQAQTLPQAQSAEPDTLPTYDVLVIGGGLAGITTAQRLSAEGHRALILEATDRIGGRALTDTRFSLPVDLGASWIHAADVNPLTAAVDYLRFTRVESDLKGAIFHNGERLNPKEMSEYEAMYEAFEEALHATYHKGADAPASDHLPDHPLYRSLIAADTGPLDSGAEITRTSSVEAALFRSDPDDLITEGVGAFVRRLGEGISVKINSPVVKVSYPAGDPYVYVTTQQDQSHGQSSAKVYRASRVVVTVSTGVLAAKHIRFDPALPSWKWEAIRGLPMGLLNKVVIQLKAGALAGEPNNQWVLSRDTRDLTPPLKGPVTMAFLTKPHGAPLVIGFYGGDQAREIEALGEQVALRHATSTLIKMYGAQLGPLIDETRVAVTAWGQHPHTLGSYSAALPGQSAQRAELAKPVADRVFFAGEACGPVELNGSLGAAYVSGLAAARAVHHSLKRRERISRDR